MAHTDAPMETHDYCKILIIDDDESFRSVIVRFLTRNGFEPLAAASGEAGLAQAKEQSPDLVLCDLEMPGMDGYSVLAALQRDPRLTALPVIFLTGRAAPDQVRMGMNLGVDDYLTKPVNLEDLINAIQARLARVRQRQVAPAPEPARALIRLEDTFIVRTHTKRRLVKIGVITHILAYGEYSWAYWEPGERAMLRKSLKQWLTELPDGPFVRVHRGAIVNLGYLDRIEKPPGGQMQVYLRNLTDPISVSLRLAPVLNRRLKALQVRM